MKTDFNSSQAAGGARSERELRSAAVCLSDLAPGEGGTIARVESETGIGRRLLDLGFIPGTALRVIRRAPLGDPISYEVRGTRICLRRSEASRIWVEPAPRSGSGA